MKSVRLIARLEIKGHNVVKGIRMEGMRIVGTPEKLMNKYFQEGIDEIIFYDTVASLYGRNHLTELINSVSERIFIPMIVGGGVRSIDDFSQLLRNGADKVSFNTQAVKDPCLITDAAKIFGTQCVIVEIQAKARPEGGWEPYIDNGRQRTHLDVIEWAKEVESLGAGEIFLSSVDLDGTMNGIDLNLINAVTKVVSIPVIASGGTNSAQDIVNAVKKGNANAIAIAHLLHFKKITITSLKKEILNAGLIVRPIGSK